MKTKSYLLHIGFVLAAASMLAVGAVVAVYALSDAKLRSARADIVSFQFEETTNPDVLERGRHVARTRGCFGCHGQQLQGSDFDKQWDWPKRAVAPNLARYARENTAVAIEAAVRQGVGRNGAALTSMPSYNFARLSDDDLAALISFLRSAPVVDADLPAAALGLAARWDLLTGSQPHMAAWADMAPNLKHDPTSNPQLAHGEYLAMTMCNECHGLDVRGQTFYRPYTPDLAMVAAIERNEFERIIKTGTGVDGRPLGLMRLVAPDRFPDLADDEIDALYAYLSSLAEEPIPAKVFWRP